MWAAGSYVESGVGSKTLIEHWNGAAWSIVPSPNPSTSFNILAGLAAGGPNDVWAVGRQIQPMGRRTPYQTLTEHWDGHSWQVIPSPNVASRGYRTSLQSVTEIAADDVWAVGQSSDETGTNATSVTMHWDGTAWTIIANPMVAQDYLVQVEALARDNVWAVGFTITSDFAHYDTLILHWDGLAWSIVPSPNTSDPYNTLTGISAIGPDDIWAVGYSGLPNSAGGSQALALHWDGGSWTIVPTAQPSTGNYLLGVVALSNANVWAVGGDTVADQAVSQHWAGAAWAAVPLPRARKTATLNAVTATPTGTLWAVGSQGSSINPGVALIYSQAP